MVVSEISTTATLDDEKLVRVAVDCIGYDSHVDDMSSAARKGLSDKTCEVVVRINMQTRELTVHSNSFGCWIDDRGIYYIMHAAGPEGIVYDWKGNHRLWQHGLQ